MKYKALAVGFFVACSLLTPPFAVAETRSDVINGATCMPYPPYGSTNNKAVPYKFWLYGFGQSAYCHFTIPDDWSVQDLSYVLFSGTVGTGSEPIRVRLCVYSTSGLSSSCGAERTIGPSSIGVNWVEPPATIPSFATGAFLSVRFPDDEITAFKQFIPVWSR